MSHCVKGIPALFPRRGQAACSPVICSWVAEPSARPRLRLTLGGGPCCWGASRLPNKEKADPTPVPGLPTPGPGATHVPLLRPKSLLGDSLASPASREGESTWGQGSWSSLACPLAVPDTGFQASSNSVLLTKQTPLWPPSAPHSAEVHGRVFRNRQPVAERTLGQPSKSDTPPRQLWAGQMPF